MDKRGQRGKGQAIVEGQEGNDDSLTRMVVIDKEKSSRFQNFLKSFIEE